MTIGTHVEYRVRLPADPRAPAVARRVVRCLDQNIEPATLETIELLVSELVTNSVRHAGLGQAAWIEVELLEADRHVRVEVTDPGKGFDPAGVPTADEQRGSGWGLFLVSKLARRWGVHHDAMTRVWFEVDVVRTASIVGSGIQG